MLVGWTFCSHSERLSTLTSSLSSLFVSFSSFVWGQWNLAPPGAFVSSDQLDAQAVYELPLLGGSGFPEKPLAPNLSRGYVLAPDPAPFIQCSTRDPNRRGPLFEAETGGKGEKKDGKGAKKGNAKKGREDNWILRALEISGFPSRITDEDAITSVLFPPPERFHFQYVGGGRALVFS